MRSFHKRYDYIIKKLGNFIDVSGLTVVDCACGEGDGSVHFHKLTCDVTGVDIDKNCIAIAKKAFPGLAFRTESILSMSLLDDFADIFVCSETMEHLNPKQSRYAVKEIKRVCKPHAYICITVPNNKKTCLAKKLHKQYLSLADLRGYFSEYEMIHNSVFYKNPVKKNRGNTVVIFRRHSNEN